MAIVSYMNNTGRVVRLCVGALLLELMVSSAIGSWGYGGCCHWWRA